MKGCGRSDCGRCYECDRYVMVGGQILETALMDLRDPDRLWCSVDCRDRSAEKQAEFSARVAER